MRHLALVAAMVLLAAVPCFADTVVVGDLGGGLGVRVLYSSGDRVVLEYTIGSFERTPVEIAGETFYVLNLGGESNMEERGAPDVPHVCRSVVIPDEGEMAVEVISSEYEEIAGIPVAPSKGVLERTVDPATVPYEFGEAYGSGGWYPGELAWGREPYILRDFRGLCVVVQPFAVKGSEGLLRVYTRMVVEVRRVGPGGANVLTVQHRDRMNGEFARIYDRHFLNFKTAAYVPVGEVGEMLIITNDLFHNDLLPLVSWKNQMGIPTTLVDVSTIGNNSTSIKSYIQNLYNTTDLAFVILVGDGAEIAYPTASGGASDPSYSLLAGADNYPDVFVGRFSASASAQAQTQVSRTITYERDPMAGAAWYHKGTGIASNQGPGDDSEYDNVHIGNIRTDLLGFTYTEVDQIYDPSGTAAMVSNALNNGRSIINYCGHGSMTAWGSTGFSVTNVNALVNDNMLPFIFDVACVNGAFASGTCFAEAWMRASHNGVPTGAIGIYASSINQSWNSPMCGQDEMDDLLVQQQKRTFGGLCYNGSCRMMDEYGTDGANMFKTWHVFGDPSLRVRTDTPTALTVNHGATIEESAPTFTVTVPGVEGALCALSYSGVYHGSAFSGSGGVAVIPVVGTLPAGEDITLTVTSFNHIPYIAPVSVGSAVMDPDLSTIAVNTGVMLRPDGLGDSTMTVTVTVRDGGGNPMPGIPAGDVVASGSGASWIGRNIIFCSSRAATEQFVSAQATDANGRVTFTVTQMGGCGEVTWTATVQGIPLTSGAVSTVRSPDLTGNGQTDFQDTNLYVQMLLAAFGYCSNFSGDAGQLVNFQDTIKFLPALVAHASCP